MAVKKYQTPLFEVIAHIPHGSGDAEYRIMQGRRFIAIVDPDMTLKNPAKLAQRIADALNYVAGDKPEAAS